MAATSSLMYMMGANSLVGAINESNALRDQGDFAQKQYEANARISDEKAKEAIKRGNKNSFQHAKKVKQVIGSQRAKLAAAGIDVNSGSAMDIQLETAEYGLDDAETIKNNAWKEAWGFEVDAVNQRAQGEMSNLTARHQANNTLLTGGLNAAGSIYQGYNFSQNKKGGK